MANAQVTIEKTAAVNAETAPAPANDYVSIEFGNPSGGVKGIILPWTVSEVASPSVGTLIFDSAMQKVKLYTTTANAKAGASGWLDYSGAAETATTPFQNNTSLQERDNAQVIIGASTSTVGGILVLETPFPDAQPKAMVLPRVNSYTDIVNPSAGMMVYVTSNNQLAVFNGKEWSFWRGE